MLLKLVGPYWVAPLFAAILSAMALGAFFFVRPHTYEASFTGFFCFLPMAFTLAASAQAASQKQVRAPQRRIERLEARATD